jgi:hypothetical protein
LVSQSPFSQLIMGGDDFIKRLEEFTGQNWSNLDTSEWDAIPRDPQVDYSSELAAAETTAEGTTETPVLDGDSYASDDSADMILSARHLTIEERPQQDVSNRGYKLNKVHKFAADAPEYLRFGGGVEKVHWKETGLKKGAVSADGDAFCPWKLAQGYPDMYVGKRNSELVR